MRGDWSNFFQDSLAERMDAGLHRTRGGPPLNSDSVDFGSNDYLGLRSHPLVHSALSQSRIVGSGASPVLTGHTPHHAALETLLAEMNDTADALVFSCGFSCHSGVLACLASSSDLILSDQLNHASLIDGCRLSKAQVHVFPHNDFGYVESYLLQHRNKYDKVLLVTESVFSMDGDCAPLHELSGLSARFNFGLVVDEAHALGVFGERGSGLVEELQLEHRPLAKLGTLSKAAGVIGGYVCGGRELIQYLVNHCRSYIYSTAPPIPIVMAALASLRLIQSMRTDRTRLRDVSANLRQRLCAVGWNVPTGESPIVPIIVGTPDRAQSTKRELECAQLHVPAIRPPTVPPATSRLRVSLSTKHTAADIDRLVACLSRLKSL